VLVLSAYVEQAFATDLFANGGARVGYLLTMTVVCPVRFTAWRSICSTCAARQPHWQRDVLRDRQPAEQVIGLEDEPDVLAAEFGERSLLLPGQLLVAQPDLARRGPVQARRAMQERALARAGRPITAVKVPRGMAIETLSSARTALGPVPYTLLTESRRTADDARSGAWMVTLNPLPALGLTPPRPRPMTGAVQRVHPKTRRRPVRSAVNT
jgi:hypothetical protein